MREQRKMRARLRATTSVLALAIAWTAAQPLALGALGDGAFQLSAAHADSSCFLGETLVTMADGSERPIRDIRPGDRVLGGFGRVNRVRGVERVRLGRRSLYGVNRHAPFFTAEHPFHTPAGWKALDPAATAAETPGLRVGRLAEGDLLRRLDAAAMSVVGATALAPGVVFALERILWFARAEAPAETLVFNLLLDGDSSYVANGFLVHNKGDGGGDNDGGDGDSGGGGDSNGGGGEDGGGDDGGGGGEDDGGDTGDDGSDDGSSGGEDGGDRLFRGSAEPAGPDLSRDEERDLISRGWK